MRRRTWKRRAAIIAGAAALFWVLGGVLLCESALRVPRTAAPSGTAQPVSISARDGARLRAWFVPAPETRRCVLVLHGIADSRALGFAPMFRAAGYSTLAPDSRAHGESGGEFVTYGLLERWDVLDWADWLKQRGCERIFGLGESLGGAVLIQAAAERPVFQAIAAECSYRSVRAIAEQRVLEKLPSGLAAKALVESAFLYARLRYGFRFDEAAPERSAARLTTPLLLIHGMDDERTPAAHSRVLFDAAGARKELWLVRQAGHVNASIVTPVEFRDRVLAWFDGSS